MQDKHKRSEEEKNDRLASWNDEVFLHEWNIILNYTQSLSDLSWSKVGSRGWFGEEKVLSEAQKWRKTDCHLLLGREENKSNGKENGPLWMSSFFLLSWKDLGVWGWWGEKLGKVSFRSGDNGVSFSTQPQISFLRFSSFQRKSPLEKATNWRCDGKKCV